MSEMKVKYYLIDRYLNEINKKINLKQKPNKYEYFVYYCYYLNIIKLIICLYFEDDLKLILYDPTYFMGGIGHFSSISFILAAILGTIMYKNIHLNSNKKQFEWIEIFDVIKGNRDYTTVKFLKFDQEHFSSLLYRVKLIYKICSYLYTMLSKYIIAKNSNLPCLLISSRLYNSRNFNIV